jgi:hypothetical protein
VEPFARGAHFGGSVVEWNGRDPEGRRVPAAVYFVRWSGAGKTDTAKLIRLD